MIYTFYNIWVIPVVKIFIENLILSKLQIINNFLKNLNVNDLMIYHESYTKVVKFKYCRGKNVGLLFIYLF